VTGLHLFHDWVKWSEPFERPMVQVWEGQLVLLNGKPLQTAARYQRRDCLLCGLVQERRVII
jgi:hypothetical protein